MHLYDILLALHVGIGTVALSAFWVTAVLRKGTPQHRRIGGVYLLAMLGILLTAVPMAVFAFFRGNAALGVFLLYLALVTGTAAWLAFRAVRRRSSFDSYIAMPYQPLAWLNLAAGATVLLLGVVEGDLILQGMSVIGLSLGYRMTRVARYRGALDRNWWLQRHYTGIIGSGAAAHIAFLNLGLRHLVPASWFQLIAYVAWFAPVVASAAVVIYLNRRYRRTARTAGAAAQTPAPGHSGQALTMER
jgi:hypothetical protein